MIEIYWITRLGALNDFCMCMTLICGLALAASFIYYVYTFMDSHEDYATEEDKKNFKTAKRLLTKTTLVFLIFVLGLIFIPTKKDMLAIYGLGGTIDYVKSNDKAKKLPDKVIDALDMYLEEKSKDGR